MIATRNFSKPSKSNRPAGNRAAAGSAAAGEAAHDAELVRRFNTGDESAFIEIVNRYRERIFSVALALVRNHSDAEEIAQDTFIRANRGLARFRGDSSLATWLYRITVNLSRNRYWYFFRRRRHLMLSLDRPLNEGSDATFGDLVADDASTPAIQATTGEFTALVASCMDRLDSRQREILTLRSVLDRSYEEIAETLGLNVGTVKSRIARARASLRELLSKACPEFSDARSLGDWFEFTRQPERLKLAAS